MHDGNPDTERAALGRLCTAILGVSGTFEVGASRPDDNPGCWPVGVWRLSPAVQQNECPSPPQLDPEYAFRVTRDDDNNFTYKYLTHPNYDRVRLKVSSGDGGVCQGTLESYSPDGKTVITLKAGLQEDMTVSGFGQYDIYAKDEWE